MWTPSIRGRDTPWSTCGAPDPEHSGQTGPPVEHPIPRAHGALVHAWTTRPGGLGGRSSTGGPPRPVIDPGTPPRLDHRILRPSRSVVHGAPGRQGDRIPRRSTWTVVLPPTAVDGAPQVDRRLPRPPSTPLHRWTSTHRDVSNPCTTRGPAPLVAVIPALPRVDHHLRGLLHVFRRGLAVEHALDEELACLVGRPHQRGARHVLEAHLEAHPAVGGELVGGDELLDLEMLRRGP